MINQECLDEFRRRRNNTKIRTIIYYMIVITSIIIEFMVVMKNGSLSRPFISNCILIPMLFYFSINRGDISPNKFVEKYMAYVKVSIIALLLLILASLFIHSKQFNNERFMSAIFIIVIELCVIGYVKMRYYGKYTEEMDRINSKSYFLRYISNFSKEYTPGKLSWEDIDNLYRMFLKKNTPVLPSWDDIDDLYQICLKEIDEYLTNQKRRNREGDK